MKMKWSYLLVLLLFPLLLLAGCGGDQPAAESWSFVMFGDCRGDNDTDKGVSPYLNTIAKKIASLKPEMVIIAGDMANGNCLTPASPLYPAGGNFTDAAAKTMYAGEFANFKTAMKPVYDYSINSGIPIYTVRGNHENEDMGGAPIPVLKQAYQEAFSSYVPSNGPNNGANDDQRGFSWSLTHKNVTVVAADQYFNFDPTFAGGTTPWSGYHSIDQVWVTQQFQQSTAPYKVFMAHEPMFQTEGNDPAELYNEGAQHFFGINAAGLATRKVFWNGIGNAGVQLYLTGHLHLLTTSAIPDDNGNPMFQLMAGNGGAPGQPFINNPEAGVTTLYNNGNTYSNGKVNATYGFSLATVEDTKMTIRYYSLNPANGNWTVAAYTTKILPKAASPLARR